MTPYDDDTIPSNISPPASTEAETLKIDPKLLAKALKKMRGLVLGNGMRTEDVKLSDNPTETAIKMYRFRARTFLKLAPEHGTRIEPGRNTKAELVTNQNEFNNALNKAIITARTDPHQRKIITDMIAGRPDKGFGLDQQKLRIPQLARNLVMHEKCVPCANTGKTLCTKCHGQKNMGCVNCHGRKQITCPRCRGTSRIIINGKQQPCTNCHADGKVVCPKCKGLGHTKCQACAATGSMKCQVCAATGWMSHLTHIEFFAKTFFDYDRIVLPEKLVTILEKNNSKCVVKHDIEVTLKDGWMDHQRHKNATIGEKQAYNTQAAMDVEPDDTIWLDYDALCPYGPITFTLKDRPLSANLFGFQAKLLDCPPFLDSLTRVGQQALIEAAKGGRTVTSHLKKAAKYLILRDVITQTLRIKNLQKTEQFLTGKYVAGFRRDKFASLVASADMALHHITRTGRMIGVGIGLTGFSFLSALYYLMGERTLLLTQGIPEMVLWGMDAALIPIGTLMAVYGGKFASVWSQKKALENIVSMDVLSRTLPKAGKTIGWGLGLSIALTALILGLTMVTKTPLPAWLSLLKL